MLNSEISCKLLLKGVHRFVSLALSFVVEASMKCGHSYMRTDLPDVEIMHVRYSLHFLSLSLDQRHLLEWGTLKHYRKSSPSSSRGRSQHKNSDHNRRQRIEEVLSSEKGSKSSEYNAGRRKATTHTCAETLRMFSSSVSSSSFIVFVCWEIIFRERTFAQSAMVATIRVPNT